MDIRPTVRADSARDWGGPRAQRSHRVPGLRGRAIYGEFDYPLAMSTPEQPAPTNEAALRKAAEKRIQSRRGFYYYLGVWAIVSIILTGVWALSGAGYFWPIWAIGGMGIAALFMALSTFGPGSGPPSEARIQEEMKKLQ